MYGLIASITRVRRLPLPDASVDIAYNIRGAPFVLSIIREGLKKEPAKFTGTHVVEVAKGHLMPVQTHFVAALVIQDCMQLSHDVREACVRSCVRDVGPGP